LIRNVQPGSLAEEAGLKPGDVIEEVDRKPVTTLEALGQTVSQVGNRTLLLLIARERSHFFVALDLSDGKR
jgi:serine protease Do